MEDIKQEVINHNIFEKWENLAKQWKTNFDQFDAILVKDGIEDDSVLKMKTLAF